MRRCVAVSGRAVTIPAQTQNTVDAACAAEHYRDIRVKKPGEQNVIGEIEQAACEEPRPGPQTAFLLEHCCR